jgi:hypothetical protein
MSEAIQKMSAVGIEALLDPSVHRGEGRSNRHHAISVQRDAAHVQQKTANMALFFPAGRSSERGRLSLEAAFPAR